MDLIDITELQDVLGCSKSTLYRWTHLNKIPHKKINGLLRFDPIDIKRFIEKQNLENLQVTK